MTSLRVESALLDALRPYYETEWERERREKSGQRVSDAEILHRILMKVYEQKNAKPGQQIYDMTSIRK